MLGGKYIPIQMGYSFPPIWFGEIILQPTKCQLNRLFTYII
jgi:hypothetical protein